MIILISIPYNTENWIKNTNNNPHCFYTFNLPEARAISNQKMLCCGTRKNNRQISSWQVPLSPPILISIHLMDLIYFFSIHYVWHVGYFYCYRFNKRKTIFIFSIYSILFIIISCSIMRTPAAVCIVVYDQKSIKFQFINRKKKLKWIWHRIEKYTKMLNVK